MVTHLDRQHGCIWTFEDCADQCYPPPNLQSLLKLVLVPHIDNMSVQALVSLQIIYKFCGTYCASFCALFCFIQDKIAFILHCMYYIFSVM